MKASHILMAAVLALGALGGAAHAGIETTFVHVNTVEIDSSTYNVYDMRVTVGQRHRAQPGRYPVGAGSGVGHVCGCPGWVADRGRLLAGLAAVRPEPRHHQSAAG